VTSPVSRFANPVFVALDTPDLDQALLLAERVKPYVGGLKVGLEFISAQGPAGISSIVALGLPVFADTKFHDIPNTAAGAARAIARLGVTMFNVHASGGEAMMRAARAAAKAVSPDILVIAVTVLTSLGPDDLIAVGVGRDAQIQAKRLAGLAAHAGLDAVVCSAHELSAVREAAPGLMTIVPGIRPLGAELADQRRVMTPVEAKRAGADILVIGRPITAAPDPAEAAQKIYEELVESGI
jgi:orotidine-5'-phosphate decarboxylase